MFWSRVSSSSAPSAPLDLHFSKLVSFVTANACLSGGWANVDKQQTLKELQRVQEMVDSLRQSLPDELSSEDKGKKPWAWYRERKRLTYFDCEDVIEILEENSEDARNWIGRYKDARLKQWAAVLHAYRQHKLFLIEGAQVLEREMAWEIPYLRAQIAACEKEMIELDKAEVRYENFIKDHLAKYKAQCESRRIKGIDLRREFEELCATSLPVALNDILKQIQSENVREALVYYDGFTSFMVTDAAQVKRLAVIKGLIDCGVPLELKQEGSVNMQTVIDLEPLTIVEEQAFAIDWGEDQEPEAKPLEDTTESVHNSASGELGPDIDWTSLNDIYIGNHDEFLFGREPTAPEVTSPEEGTTSQENEILTLGESSTREKVELELLEIISFFEQRVRETKEHDSMAMFGFSEAPEKLKPLSTSRLQEFLDVFVGINEKLHHPTLHELIAVQKGGIMFEHVIKELERQTEQANKFRVQVNRLDAKRSQLIESKRRHLSTLRGKLDEVDWLRVKLQNAMSEGLNGRKVGILGLNV